MVLIKPTFIVRYTYIAHFILAAWRLVKPTINKCFFKISISHVWLLIDINKRYLCSPIHPYNSPRNKMLKTAKGAISTKFCMIFLLVPSFFWNKHICANDMYLLPPATTRERKYGSLYRATLTQLCCYCECIVGAYAVTQMRGSTKEYIFTLRLTLRPIHRLFKFRDWLITVHDNSIIYIIVSI